MISQLIYALVHAATLGLSSDDWNVRQGSSRLLSLSYPTSSGALLRLIGNTSSCPESKRRATSLLREKGYGVPHLEIRVAEVFSEFVRSSGYNDWPWVDSLPEGYPERDGVKASCLAHARGWGVSEWLHGAPNYLEYRAATRYLVCLLLSSSSPPTDKEIVLLLTRMADGDHRQYTRSGRTFAWVGAESLR